MKRVYEYPLTEWISAALHTDSLDAVLKTIKEGKALDGMVKSKADNKRYIEKILKEEISNQFSSIERPMLEVILNSVDAKPCKEKDYSIDVKVKSKGFSSSDSGKGMDLEDVLKYLIIPFNTEKKGVEEIGRFGVGFLSTFNYCLAEPKKVHLIVKTSNGSEGYVIDFYAKSHEISDLMMIVIPSSKSPTGTKVSIKKKLSKKKVVDYLKEHLENVPSYVAKIITNKKRINDHSKFEWYVQPVKLKALGRELEQQVGFKASGAGWHSRIFLTSQGVLVNRFSNEYKNINATVSFPPAVQLVEGRDEFKIDENYNICVDAVFKAFEEFLKEHGNDENVTKYVEEPMPDGEKKLAVAKGLFVEYMAGFVPSLMSALGVTDVSKISNIDSIREILFPGKKYVLTSQDMINFRPFFRKVVEDYAFEVQSYPAYAY